MITHLFPSWSESSYQCSLVDISYDSWSKFPCPANRLCLSSFSCPYSLKSGVTPSPVLFPSNSGTARTHHPHSSKRVQPRTQFGVLGSNMKFDEDNFILFFFQIVECIWWWASRAWSTQCLFTSWDTKSVSGLSMWDLVVPRQQTPSLPFTLFTLSVFAALLCHAFVPHKDTVTATTSVSYKCCSWLQLTTWDKQPVSTTRFL